MKRLLIPLLSLTLLVTGCTSNQNTSTDINRQEITIPKENTLNYEVEDFHQLEETDHYKIVLSYPVIVANKDSEIINKLNNDIKATVDEEVKAFKDYADEFFNDPNVINPISWELDISSNIERFDDQVISLLINTYHFAGGAHPNYYSKAYNISLQDEEEINLDSLFSDDQTALRGLLNKKLVDLGHQDMHPDLPRLEKITKFYMASNGITLYFDPYDIGPYAEGGSSYFFSLDEIKPILEEYSIKLFKNNDYQVSIYPYQDHQSFDVPIITIADSKDAELAINTDILRSLEDNINENTSFIHTNIGIADNKWLSITMYITQMKPEYKSSVVSLNYDVSDGYKRTPLNKVISKTKFEAIKEKLKENYQYHYLYDESNTPEFTITDHYYLTPGYIHLIVPHKKGSWIDLKTPFIVE